MLPTKTDFTKEELEFIINNATALILKNRLTGINLIYSEDTPLPDEKIIIHYLQDSEAQIEFIINEIKKRYEDTNTKVVPRFTFYRFMQEYTKKLDFRKTYGKATFLDDKLNIISIEEVVKKPTDLIVCNEEKDLLVYGLSDEDIVDLAEDIIDIDPKGPSRWLDLAIIIKDNGLLKNIDRYVRKDYASIKMRHSEFYSIIHDAKTKRYLRTYVSKICNNLRDKKGITISQGSLLIVESQINKDLNDYIAKNITGDR